MCILSKCHHIWVTANDRYKAVIEVGKDLIGHEWSHIVQNCSLYNFYNKIFNYKCWLLLRIQIFLGLMHMFNGAASTVNRFFEIFIKFVILLATCLFLESSLFHKHK